MKAYITIPAILTFLSLTGCNRDVNDILSPLFDAPAHSRPRIISSNPSIPGGAYNPGLPLFVDFDRSMDLFTTERAFSVSGASSSAGSLRWAGNRLIYDLNNPLEPGIAFVLRVTGSAKSTDNATMETDYIVHFISGTQSDSPAVLSSTPASNAQGVPPDTEILFVFSRPMDRESTEESFTISPAVYGAFLWSADDTVLTFRPYNPLNIPIRYDVGLSTSARDREGIELGAAESFSFQTGSDLVRPTIQEVREQGAIAPLSDGFDGVQKESPFVVTFSEPMNATETERSASLIRKIDGASVSLRLFWAPSFTSLTLQPQADLLPETEYRLTVTTIARDQSNNALLQNYRLDFRVSNAAGAVNSNYLTLNAVSKILPGPVEAMDPSPDVTTTLIVPGSDLPTSGTAGTQATIQLDFSHSLDPASIAESISITKAIGAHPASGRILGISIINQPGIPDSRIQLTVGGLGAGNEYRLRIAGGNASDNRAIHSIEQSGEHATFLNQDSVLNFRVEAGP